jgi:O-antigen ligase
MELSVREATRSLLERVIFWGTLGLISLSAIPYGTADAKWESFFETAVFVLTTLWLTTSLLGAQFWNSEHRVLLPLGALILLALIQSVPLWSSSGGPALAGGFVRHALSVDPFETWRFVLKLSALALSFGMLLSFAANLQRLQILVYVVVGIALASALFGLLRSELLPHLPAVISFRLDTESSYGQFENRNHFAFLMEMALGLMLGSAVDNRFRKLRLVLIVILTSTLWVALLLTHSRGGLLCMLAEIPFFFVLYASGVTTKPQKLGRGFGRVTGAVMAAVLICLVFCVLAASIVLVGGDETISRLESTPLEFSARSAGPPKVLRPQIWAGTLRLIKVNPIFGVGFGGYSVAIPRYLVSSAQWTPEQAHNDYLELLASGGVIGAVLGLWFLVRLVRTSRRRLQQAVAETAALRCGALAGLFAVAAHSFFDFGLHITVNALIAGVLLVIAVKGISESPLVSRQI